MEHYICITCGTQFAETAGAARALPDLRGRAAVRRPRRAALDYAGETAARPPQRDHAGGAGADRIGTEPKFAIGQRALLVRTPRRQRALGLRHAARRRRPRRGPRARAGIGAIAISHPHYYSAMVEWSRAFGARRSTCTTPTASGCMRPDPASLLGGRDTAARRRADADPLRRPLRRRPGAALGGRCRRQGGLLTGDIIQVMQRPQRVSFMYSYPNLSRSRPRRCAAWPTRSRPSPTTASRRVVGSGHPGRCQRDRGALGTAVH